MKSSVARAMQQTIQASVKVGDRIPNSQLRESSTTEYDSGNNCPLPAKPVEISDLVKGKRVAIFGVPGAFTSTCSGQHVPSYLNHLDDLKAKGVDEVVCVSVNDAAVMAAWGKSLNVNGRIRMLGDGTGSFARAIGLAFDHPTMGLRCRRFSMLVNDGIIELLNVEQGSYALSDAKTMLTQMAQKQ